MSVVMTYPEFNFVLTSLWFFVETSLEMRYPPSNLVSICEELPIPSALHTVASQNVVLKLCVFVILYFVKMGILWGSVNEDAGIAAEELSLKEMLVMMLAM